MAHHHRHSTGLYPLSPRICATYSSCACFPVPRNACHTCPTQLCYQIMHQPPSGEHRDYIDVFLRLQPRTTTRLQGNELRPRAIHYADDIVLLFPQLPCLLSLLSYDALSHHVHVFLFVSVNPDVEMA